MLTYLFIFHQSYSVREAVVVGQEKQLFAEECQDALKWCLFFTFFHSTGFQFDLLNRLRELVLLNIS